MVRDSRDLRLDLRTNFILVNLREQEPASRCPRPVPRPPGTNLGQQVPHLVSGPAPGQREPAKSPAPRFLAARINGWSWRIVKAAAPIGPPQIPAPPGGRPDECLNFAHQTGNRSGVAVGPAAQGAKMTACSSQTLPPIQSLPPAKRLGEGIPELTRQSPWPQARRRAKNKLARTEAPKSRPRTESRSSCRT